MKKIILVVLLALSLEADAVCDFWADKYRSSFKLLVYSADRGDREDALHFAKQTLTHIEHVGAECEGVDEGVEKLRKTLKKKIIEFSE